MQAVVKASRREGLLLLLLLLLLPPQPPSPQPQPPQLSPGSTPPARRGCAGCTPAWRHYRSAAQTGLSHPPTHGLTLGEAALVHGGEDEGGVEEGAGGEGGGRDLVLQGRAVVAHQQVLQREVVHAGHVHVCGPSVRTTAGFCSSTQPSHCLAQHQHVLHAIV